MAATDAGRYPVFIAASWSATDRGQGARVAADPAAERGLWGLRPGRHGDHGQARQRFDIIAGGSHYRIPAFAAMTIVRVDRRTRLRDARRYDGRRGASTGGAPGRCRR